MNKVNGTKPSPKLINGKVWVPDAEGNFRRLPESDPAYYDTLLKIDSERFVELLEWVYNRNGQSSKKD